MWCDSEREAESEREDESEREAVGREGVVVCAGCTRSAILRVQRQRVHPGDQESMESADMQQPAPEADIVEDGEGGGNGGEGGEGGERGEDGERGEGGEGDGDGDGDGDGGAGEDGQSAGRSNRASTRDKLRTMSLLCSMNSQDKTKRAFRMIYEQKSLKELASGMKPYDTNC